MEESTNQEKEKTTIIDFLKEWDWPKLRKPKLDTTVWKSYGLSKEQVQSICFSTWAKVTAAWTFGFESPCLMVGKDTNPTLIWNKNSEATIEWKLNQETKIRLSKLWEARMCPENTERSLKRRKIGSDAERSVYNIKS